MAIKVPNLAEAVMLELILAEDLDLKLFKNDHTPGETDTEADYDEADFDGYAEEQLVSANWVITPGAPASAAYPDVTFTRTSSGATQTIYGYYVVERASGNLRWAERWDDNDPTAPYDMVNNGDTITWPGRFTLKDTTD